MQITVTFRHMDSTDALKEHAIEKIQHLDRYFDRVHDVHVVLSAEKNQHIAEVTVHSPGEVFKATAKTEDMYATIDSVITKLERHLVRRKERTKIEVHKLGSEPKSTPSVAEG